MSSTRKNNNKRPEPQPPCRLPSPIVEMRPFDYPGRDQHYAFYGGVPRRRIFDSATGSQPETTAAQHVARQSAHGRTLTLAAAPPLTLASNRGPASGPALASTSRSTSRWTSGSSLDPGLTISSTQAPYGNPAPAKSSEPVNDNPQIDPGLLHSEGRGHLAVGDDISKSAEEPFDWEKEFLNLD